MVDENTKTQVIILGAGVTGLSAGVRFLDSGCNVCILEKAEQTGGLAKTVVRGDYRLDIGPHHLFSQNEAILKEIERSKQFIKDTTQDVTELASKETAAIAQSAKPPEPSRAPDAEQR